MHNIVICRQNTRALALANTSTYTHKQTRVNISLTTQFWWSMTTRARVGFIRASSWDKIRRYSSINNQDDFCHPFLCPIVVATPLPPPPLLLYFNVSFSILTIVLTIDLNGQTINYEIYVVYLCESNHRFTKWTPYRNTYRTRRDFMYTHAPHKTNTHIIHIHRPHV